MVYTAVLKCEITRGIDAASFDPGSGISIERALCFEQQWIRIPLQEPLSAPQAVAARMERVPVQPQVQMMRMFRFPPPPPLPPMPVIK